MVASLKYYYAWQKCTGQSRAAAFCYLAGLSIKPGILTELVSLSAKTTYDVDFAVAISPAAGHALNARQSEIFTQFYRKPLSNLVKVFDIYLQMSSDYLRPCPAAGRLRRVVIFLWDSGGKRAICDCQSNLKVVHVKRVNLFERFFGFLTNRKISIVIFAMILTFRVNNENNLFL